ncbi:MAG: RagB/SusD family nutrient uptake outer membrane protein [Bacteroidales bacterium]|jgi:hypothetical protein
MKQIKYSVTILLIACFSACDLLDIDESTGTTKDDVFESVERTKNFLSHIYSFMPSDFNAIDGTSRSCATDDAEYVWNTSNVRIMNDGTWSKINTIDTQWGNSYTAIRAANQFLDNFTLSALDRYLYQPNYNDVVAQFINYRYEARFLRAFYHFELAKRYGDIPLADRVFTEEEVNSLTKTPFADVIAYIADECDSAAMYLPVSYTLMPGAQETGRATKGAAMALKSRALLYAASELHNPTNNTDLWKKAAKAALALIDSAELKGWYTLPNNFYDFNVVTSKELILESREAKANYFEKANFPMGIEGGNTGICPSQNLVDAFEMTKASGGGEFSWTNPVHSAAPYTNRDQRLNRTVLRDGSTFKGSVIQTYIGGTNAQPLEGATKTGYYLRKLLVETINLAPASTTTADHYWPVFRYAEILLNYAEAMNEAFPANSQYTDGTYGRSAEWALNKVRSRALINEVSGLNYANFQKKVRNERRVELAFEDHRFWDIRRWKIADETKTIYGTKVELVGANKVYTPNQVVATRFWHDRMYLYPIPASEGFINPNLGQNTGW